MREAIRLTRARLQMLEGAGAGDLKGKRILISGSGYALAFHQVV